MGNDTYVLKPKKTNSRNSFIRICMGNDTYVLEPKKKQKTTEYEQN